MLANVTLSNTETTLKLAGANENLAILSMIFYNNDTVNRTITLYAYPTGGSAGASTTILKDYTIPAGDSFVWTTDDKLALGPNDKVSGLCDVASKVYACVNYVVMV